MAGEDTVTVADDDAAMREALPLALELLCLPTVVVSAAAGFFGRAANPARDRLARHIRMPGLNGLELSRQLPKFRSPSYRLHQ